MQIGFFRSGVGLTLYSPEASGQPYLEQGCSVTAGS